MIGPAGFMHTPKAPESIGKVFYQTNGIGKAKYTISFHNGHKSHEDGSPFFDIRIFRNKKKLAEFRKDLLSEGYIED